MKRIVLALSLSFAIAACGTSVADDGFANLKYGMTSEQLRPFGFDCRGANAECDQSDPPPAAGRATLFEKPVRLSINMHEGRLSQINVMMQNYSDDEIIAMFANAYGDPSTCRFNNALAATVERHVWSASDGATITVSKILEYGAAPNMSRLSGTATSAIYRDPQQSADFKRKSC